MFTVNPAGGNIFLERLQKIMKILMLVASLLVMTSVHLRALNTRQDNPTGSGSTDLLRKFLIGLCLSVLKYQNRISGDHSCCYEEFCLLQYVGGTYHLHLQGLRINRLRYQHESRFIFRP
jgi:hypothetical protein